MREDFSPRTIREIAQKAMYICARCLCLTGYGTSEGKARTIADAAHMKAASGKGPRAGSTVTPRQLKSAANGIWLCKVCHKIIDDDPTYFDESRLRSMKTAHEDVIRRIVGKDLETALLNLRNHRQYHNETREFVSFLENKRVLYEGMDQEFPPRVLDSLALIRERLIQTRARVNPGTELSLALNQLQKAIDSFLRQIGKDIDQKTLQCNSADPNWQIFAAELSKLRAGIVIIIKILAGNADYKLTWF